MEQGLSYYREFQSLIYFLLFLAQHPHLNRNIKKLNQCCINRQGINRPQLGSCSCWYLCLASLEVSLYVFLCQKCCGGSAFISCPSRVSSFNEKTENNTADLKQFGRSFTKSSCVKQHLIIAKSAFTIYYCNIGSLVVQTQ